MNRDARILGVTLLVTGLSFFHAPILCGQDSTTGDIRGIVFDQSGAPIPGAALRFVDGKTGSVVNLVASGDGSYAYLSVRPGTQNLTVTANGFAGKEVRGLVVLVGRTTFQNIVLKPAEITDVIDVIGTEPLVQSGHSEISEVIERKSLDSLPRSPNCFRSSSRSHQGSGRKYRCGWHNRTSVERSGRRIREL